MRRWLCAAVAAAVVLSVSARAAEDVTEEEAEQLTLNCGEIKNSNNSYQIGTGLWLEYNAQTRRPVNGECVFLSVGVEAWVIGVSGSAMSNWDMFTAVAKKQVPVPSPGDWVVSSKHYRSYLWLFTFSNGQETSIATVELESSTSDGTSEDPLQIYNDPYNTNIVSPLIVDSWHDGFHLTAVDDGVLFDIDADGELDRVAWTVADGDDEFLAMDRNGNGRIDDGSELFGNHTPVYAGTAVTTANGFEALAFMEGPSFGPSTLDGRIDARDALFSRLLLWRDANHNGISESDEMRPLARAGLAAIDTVYETARRRDRYGNEFRQRAKGTWADGEYFIYDVWLKRR